jgi:phenylalanine ammonia-lyase
MAAGEFSRLLVSHWRDLHEKLRSQDEEIIIDGRSLSVASVVACARYIYTSRIESLLICP